MINSQKKGKRKEREIAKIINKKFGTNVRRTPQSGGLSFKGDIIDLHGPLKAFHFEIKCQEKLNIWKAIRQSEGDAPIGKTPIVVFSRNFERDYVALEFETFLNLLLIIEELKQ